MSKFGFVHTIYVLPIFERFMFTFFAFAVMLVFQFPGAVLRIFVLVFPFTHCHYKFGSLESESFFFLSRCLLSFCTAMTFPRDHSEFSYSFIFPHFFDLSFVVYDLRGFEQICQGAEDVWLHRKTALRRNAC